MSKKSNEYETCWQFSNMWSSRSGLWIIGNRSNKYWTNQLFLLLDPHPSDRPLRSVWRLERALGQIPRRGPVKALGESYGGCPRSFPHTQCAERSGPMGAFSRGAAIDSWGQVRLGGPPPTPPD